jgi:LysR family transcriptional regulator, regulator for bpeEF and oprC
MDQLLAMRVFNKVADRSSFARAADELNLSRAAASEQVAALEKHLGVRLLHRTTRRVSLTAEGTEFLRRSRRILDELRDAEEMLRDTRTRPQGKLRVDVPVAFGRYLLLPALPEFTRRYPAIELELRLNDRIVDLVADGVDVALRVGSLQAGVVARRVSKISIVTCAAPAYLADHAVPQTPDDLRQHRLLGLTTAAGAPPEWSFPEPYTPRRLQLSFAMLFNASEAPLISAAAGLGIARAADMLAAEYVARGELELILEEFVVPGPPVSLVYPSGGHQAAKVRVFSDFAADLLLRWNTTARRWISPLPAPPTPIPTPKPTPSDLG